jgi:hypothetical protein
MQTKLLGAAAALVAASLVFGVPAAVRADNGPPSATTTTTTTTQTTTTTTPTSGNPTAPPGFYDRTYRLDLHLEDVNGLFFSATLNELPPSVSWPAQQWLIHSLDSSAFDVDGSAATCFVVTAKTAVVPCSQIAKLVDSSPDGIDVSTLVQPVDARGGMAFKAKKITVWLDASGDDKQPPADHGSPGGDAPPPPVPAKLYSKNIRLNVNLQDVSGLVFDASVNDIPGSVPADIRAYLEAVLDGSAFELDASKATCFVVRHSGVQNAVGCASIATLVDQAADGIDATILGKAVKGSPVDFVAKKVILFQ